MEPQPGADAGVVVALEDGGLELDGGVASVVGDPDDVDAVGEHDLDEGVGQDGPNGL